MKEMSFLELDNRMVALGYLSELESDWDEIANNKQIAYTKDGEHHDVVKFEVLSTHGEDESPLATFIKILEGVN